jgi:hypothetical protein
MKNEYETVRYHLVYSELVLAARQRGLVQYAELARINGFRDESPETTRRIGEILLAISSNEVQYNRPMLSALALKPKGAVPILFFNQARKLGLLKSDNPDDEKAFWLSQKDACYRTWQQYLMDDYHTADY